MSAVYTGVNANISVLLMYMFFFTFYSVLFEVCMVGPFSVDKELFVCAEKPTPHSGAKSGVGDIASPW